MRTTRNTWDPLAPDALAPRVPVTPCAGAETGELEEALCGALLRGARDVILEIEEPLDRLSSKTLDVIVRMAAFQLRRGDRLWIDMACYDAPELRLMQVDRQPLRLLRELRDVIRIAELEEAAVWS